LLPALWTFIGLQIVTTDITGIMRTIAFDLDGTLIDTAPDLISTLNLVLAGEGLPPLDHDEARRMIGGGS
jgi:phosphoglycolate phosphatase-like HAD superfamily hydrolase